ncbi:phage antirepressor [Limosilactobacillus caecicola]|uniref:phage antirepressor n=1 Tax=Limosilactobacillus caecicola TaxID=2941332 RepID=UPI00203C3A41|nr:phage antirepressor [Limosilactobacillus caecicola]
MTPQLFKYKDQQVRTVIINNEPYFVGKDVADILGYSNGSRDINAHTDKEDRLKYRISTAGQTRKQTVINESGLYSLILSSKLPQAKEFKHWVTSEVLPSIRKHGAYMTDQKAFDITHNASGLADLLQQAANQLKEKDVQIAEMKPKAIFADAVATSKSDILIGQLAKLLRQNGYQTGQNRLFRWMREHHYLCSKGIRYNQPTQRAMELGLFKVRERTVNNPDGSTRITVTTKVTGKGQQYFINRFLNSEPNQLVLEIETA